MNNKTKPMRPRPLAAALSDLGRTAGMVLLGGSTVMLASAGVEAQENERRGSSSAMLEEVVVTARKRAEMSQDVPMAISAFGSDQIEALKVRDLTNLSVGMPNVALDDVGTTRGTANFSIRGLGINSSIPSIDPTVGLFINGVYVGMNNGVIFDVFDLESIEVLRGPQGILFGRNVTGGAVLMNWKKPQMERDLILRAAVDGGGDGGLNRYVMAAGGGAITDKIAVRANVYWNDDEGYFENDFNGDDVGAVTQKMARGTVLWTPTEDSQFLLRYEYSQINSDGPVAQSHTNGLGIPGYPYNTERNSFNSNYDEVGYLHNKSQFVSAQYDMDVDFGDGTITAIYGYRNSRGLSLSDIDAQPVALFHSPAKLESEQNSMEVRYNGQFGPANVTTGVYWFDNDVTYHERRRLLGELTSILTGGALPTSIPYQIQDGGGYYTVKTWGVFTAVDYDLTDNLVLTAGIRWSSEEKSARIASLNLNTNVLDIPSTIAGGTPVYSNPVYGADTRCNFVIGPACPVDFRGNKTWDTWAPKIGLNYTINDASQVYASWSRAYRSGGYNLRNTIPDIPPGPFDEERVDSYELGYKSTHDWGRLNAAMFYTDISDMQREVNRASESSGVAQVILNTADASIFGVEMDGAFPLTDSLVLTAGVGYIDASYDKVRYDLNGDGVVNGQDKNLDLPRAAKWTYNAGLNYDFELGEWGYSSARISYAYRDKSMYTDNNLGYIREQNILDVGVDFYSNSGRWVLGLYGRNLLDDVKHGGDTQLPEELGPVPLGGTFSPLAKGQVYGAEITYNLN